MHHVSPLTARAAAPFTFHRHDLRRTCATNLAKAGIPRATISRVLNPVDRGPRATAVYQRYEFDAEKRAALEAWDRRLTAVLTHAPADVLTFRYGETDRVIAPAFECNPRLHRNSPPVLRVNVGRLVGALDALREHGGPARCQRGPD